MNPQATAQSAAARLTPHATSLVSYHAEGAVLIAGPAQQALAAARALPPTLSVVVLGQGTPVEKETPDAPGPTLVQGRLAALEGYLGAFHARAESAASTGGLDLGPLSPHPDGHYDLVLDLGATPVLDRELPPPGYYPAAGDAERLQGALDEIPAMVGDFEKPKFFDYDPELCAHGRRGLTACTRCIDACPAEAIQSAGERIEVDPHLCQGGGTCATVCPGGAIRYAYPTPEDTREQARTLVKTFLQAGGEPPTLLLHDGASAALVENPPPTVLLLQLEELACAGLELWLAALAWGARSVVLLDSGVSPPRSRTALDGQIEIAHAILAGMGHRPDRIQRWQPPPGAMAWQDLPAAEDHSRGEPAGFAPLNEKRTTAFLAIDHLYAHAPKRRAFIDLPTGAPFGSAQIDQGACTLCLACVSVCPGKALRDGGEQPALLFVEANCLQCGMCTRACPEDAIWIGPRLLYDRQKRQTPRLLKEEPPFLCIQCGKPFSTQSMVRRMTEHLHGHHMFQGEGIKRLQMCEDCRVRSMVSNEQGEQWFHSGGGA